MINNSWLKRLMGNSDPKEMYTYQADFEGLNFSIPQKLQNQVKNGDAGDLITHQYIALSMLVEQGNAETIPGGFIVPTEVAVQLDNNTRELLGLPIRWKGKIKADVRGTTGRTTFAVNLSVQTTRGDFTSAYQIEGPLLKLTSSQQFMLSPAQQLIFGASEEHKQSEKAEYDNLKLLLALQKSQEIGADIDLGHFEKLDIKAPDFVSIEAELDSAGNLILTPFMGQNASHEQVSRTLGQLLPKHATALRVGAEIILFDEQKLKAVNEILSNRVVPKEQVKQFLEQPTAFIDASLVDLDLGFSLRVKGATKFQHAYFGETDESGINWFGKQSGSESVYSIGKLTTAIEDEPTLQQFHKQYDDALKTGAQELCFEGNTYDISDQKAVTDTINKIQKKLTGNSEPFPTEESDVSEEPDIQPENEITVVDVALNDEQLDAPSPTIEKAIADVLYPDDVLDWNNYIRSPYPHQSIGIRWIIGLAESPSNEKDSQQGSLLADDMGLGKTLMALSAIDQLYKIHEAKGQTKKPSLVVAPLSLVENWKDEVDKTFSKPPFSDVVILQSDSDLKKYREGGVEIRNQKPSEDSTLTVNEAEIHYSLKVGKQFGTERLDLPSRLVITTYQTLRDYQFSLCRIDWGMVIFDEAQNIKNPNALQTRAAKGLKADFKLVTTGTPVENSLADFWCLMDTACPGHLNSYQAFRQNYIAPIIQAAGDEIEETRERVGRELRLKVGALMLRRLKEDNLKGLPAKRIFVGIQDDHWRYMQKLQSEMIGHQREIYDATINAQGNDETNHVLSALQRLRDVSLHPNLADGGRLDIPRSRADLKRLMNESAKMCSLISLLQDIKTRNEKCIIFAVNKRLQAFLSLALGQWFELGPLSIINGDAKAVAKRKSVPTRKSMIADFEAREGFNVIIMSPVAAGVGLTVVGANNVIHYERHWNPAKEAQATDRVYRIGQNKEVNIYIPLLHHPDFESFDVNLHKLLSKKTQLKDAVVTPEQVIPNPGGFGNNTLHPSHRINAEDLNKISWQQFEALCAELMNQHFGSDSCWLTQSGSDFGADVVLSRQGEGWLIQCKHTSNARYDGYDAIQKIYSARVKYETELSKPFANLILATNAKVLSARARTLAEQYQVQIINYDDFEHMLLDHSLTFEKIIKRIGKKRLHLG